MYENIFTLLHSLLKSSCHHFSSFGATSSKVYLRDMEQRPELAVMSLAFIWIRNECFSALALNTLVLLRKCQTYSVSVAGSVMSSVLITQCA